ncbi:unnamed protein product [Leptidea sinapis]|uniref:Uncharacterized protein n=1 Tax=Leptidea sinapis TaxID=189913 RepID=A0A5E4QUU0_9NEOP|nr:unnamed protein product [Leptidea sinapis]
MWVVVDNCGMLVLKVILGSRCYRNRLHQEYCDISSLTQEAYHFLPGYPIFPLENQYLCPSHAHKRCPSLEFELAFHWQMENSQKHVSLLEVNDTKTMTLSVPLVINRCSALILDATVSGFRSDVKALEGQIIELSSRVDDIEKRMICKESPSVASSVLGHKLTY